MQTHKNLIATILKIAVGVGLLGFIFSNINWNEMLVSIKNVQWGLLLLGFSIFLPSNWISGLRWKRLLSAKGIHVPLIKLVKYYYLGNFFGFFFPSAIGGDISRVYYLHREINHLEESVSSAMIERLLGILTSIFLVFFALFAGKNLVAAIDIGSIVAMTILVILASWIVFRFPLSRLQKTRLSDWKPFKNVIGIIQALQAYQNHLRVLWEGFALSIFYQVSMVICTYLVSLALGDNTSFIYFLIFTPLVWVISIIPVSFNGVGTREGAFIYLFALVGMKAETATAISLLNLSMFIVQGMIGAVIFLVENKGFSRAEALAFKKETTEQAIQNKNEMEAYK